MGMYYVYLLASKKNGTLYLGTTGDLVRRIKEHKDDIHEGFTKRYQVHTLVWYEGTPNHVTAIKREKQMKEWKRAWKVEAIEKINPEWKDLYDELV